VRCGASDAIGDPSLNDTAFHCMKGSEQYRLPSRSPDHSTATTTGATHDATPSHANQNRHKHSGVDRRNNHNQQNGNHAPSPSTPTLVEDLGPKAAQRLRVPKRSGDTFVNSPLLGRITQRCPLTS
jgi:hypothetical protein